MNYQKHSEERSRHHKCNELSESLQATTTDDERELMGLFF